jgi:hypothetical protein
MIKHIKYENKLNDFAKSYKFDQSQNMIYVPDIDLDSLNLYNIKKTIKKYIDQVVDEYNKTVSFSNDLDFAIFINKK